ncbi:metallopeptidase, catalytic domain-containing protein [Tanacetum coccineum]
MHDLRSMEPSMFCFVERLPPVVSAFDEWASGSGYFTFSRVADIATSDLKISFEKMNHGHREEFDGPNGVLAHAFSPTDGRLHFDEDENWSLGPGSVPNTYDFKTVTVHEIGHLLGLHHSTDPNAVMFPTIRSGTVKDKLASDDIQGIKVLYGVSNSNPFEVLNSVDDDVEFGTNANLENNEATTSGSSFMNVDNSNTRTTPVLEKIRKFEELLTSGQAILVDDAGNPLKKVELSGDYDSEDDVESVDNDMARFLASEGVDPYDDDMYEGQDLPQELEAICDNLDIRVQGRKKK